MRTFTKLFSLLNAGERKEAYFLLIMLLLMALLDMIGVASILPFITVITNPSLIETNLFLKKMFEISETFGVENNQQFLIALGFTCFVLLIVSLIFKALTTYLQLRFVHMREYSIGRHSRRIFASTICWFLNRNSAELAKTILSEVNQIMGNGIRPIVDLIARGMIIIAIVTLLIIVDPIIAISVSFLLLSAYLIIFILLKDISVELEVFV